MIINSFYRSNYKQKYTQEEIKIVEKYLKQLLKNNPNNMKLCINNYYIKVGYIEGEFIQYPITANNLYDMIKQVDSIYETSCSNLKGYSCESRVRLDLIKDGISSSIYCRTINFRGLSQRFIRNAKRSMK